MPPLLLAQVFGPGRPPPSHTLTTLPPSPQKNELHFADATVEKLFRESETLDAAGRRSDAIAPLQRALSRLNRRGKSSSADALVILGVLAPLMMVTGAVAAFAIVGKLEDISNSRRQRECLLFTVTCGA